MTRPTLPWVPMLMAATKDADEEAPGDGDGGITIAGRRYPILPLILLAFGAGILLGAFLNLVQGTFEPTLLHLFGLGAFAAGTLLLKRAQIARIDEATDALDDAPKKDRGRRGWHRHRESREEATREPKKGKKATASSNGSPKTRRKVDASAQPARKKAIKGDLPLALPSMGRGLISTGSPLTLSLDLDTPVNGTIEAQLEQDGRTETVTAEAGKGATVLSLPSPEPGPAKVRVRLMVDGVCVGETLLEVNARPPHDLVEGVLDEARDALEDAGEDLGGNPTPRQVVQALAGRTGTQLDAARRVLEQATYDELPPDPQALNEAVARLDEALAKLNKGDP